MTERQKQIAIAVTVGIIALILLLLFSRKGQQILSNGGDYMPAGVGASQLGDIIFNRAPITIPGLDFGDRDLSMIGSCCMDCSAPRPTSYKPAQGSTYVFNAGNIGGATYNYFQPAMNSGTCPPYYRWVVSQGDRVGRCVSIFAAG